MHLLPPRRGTSAAPMGRRTTPRAPLPAALPGAFFVLAWDRDREVFVLVVDDADGSNYNLGGDIPAVMRQFEGWGIKEVGCRAIDGAREFGMVQAIPGEDRVIRLIERDPSGADIVSKRLQALEEQEPGNVAHLPTLRSSL